MSGSKPSSSDVNPWNKSDFFKKITPKALAVLLGIALILLALVILFAIWKDKYIDIYKWGIEIGKPPEEMIQHIQKQLSDSIKEKDNLLIQLNNSNQEIKELKSRLENGNNNDTSKVNDLKSQLDKSKGDVINLKNTLEQSSKDITDLNKRLQESILITELPSSLRFDNKQDVIINIKQIIRENESYSNNPEIIFTTLESQLLLLSRSINTSIPGDDRKEVYELIQKSLREIGYYSGIINGDQISTYNALILFQNQYNTDFPEKPKLKPPGIFGKGTLQAIREKFNSRNENPNPSTTVDNT
jgi:hypothetical protein